MLAQIITQDLHADSQLAKQRHLPLLIIFSQDYCSFCEKLKDEIIQPMLISGDYEDKVIIRELLIDSSQDIVDFHGDRINPGDIFSRYQLYVTPSLLLLDSNGNELAERQIGINTIDYYGYYLDEAIKTALIKLRNTQ